MHTFTAIDVAAACRKAHQYQERASDIPHWIRDIDLIGHRPFQADRRYHWDRAQGWVEWD
jgi:hypothetical protein